jgi:transglutaminase-like putative cysteine protease
MSGLSKGQALACMALVVIVLAPTSFVLYEKTAPTAESLYQQGMREFENHNFNAASGLFNRSYQSFLDLGNQERALQALNMRFRADRVGMDYNLDRPAAAQKLAEAFPWVPEEERNSWLDLPTTEKMVIDGKETFYSDLVNNIAYRNLTLYHEWMDGPDHTALDDVMAYTISAEENRTGTYFNPRDYTVNGVLTIPRNLLPVTGTLNIWIPAPINTASQFDVSILGIAPSDYVISMPDLNSNLGMVYLEVPLDSLTDDVVVNVSYSYTEYQMHFDIDPSNIGMYDRTSYNYTTFTKSQNNIVISPGIVAEAKSVVGDETNPYLQAKLLYDYVIGNITYALTPEVALSALNIPLSEYVRTSRCGDCGSQSSYYCALLRSLGIPARTCGGYQTFDGGTGSHFWAEFYLPNYGWIPVDVTIAEAMDWIGLGHITDEQRAQYKAFFFGNLDNERYVIQRDVDMIPDPAPEQPSPIPAVFQWPVACCLDSYRDIPMWGVLHWNFKITTLD